MFPLAEKKNPEPLVRRDQSRTQADVGVAGAELVEIRDFPFSSGDRGVKMTKSALRIGEPA